jgi:hypothetical protein
MGVSMQNQSCHHIYEIMKETKTDACELEFDSHLLLLDFMFERSTTELFDVEELSDTVLLLKLK